MINLEEVRLSNNRFSSLPENIENLNNLSILWIDNNEIMYLPESICSLNETLLYGQNLSDSTFNFSSGNNYICNGFPNCIEESIGFNYVISYDYDTDSSDGTVSLNYETDYQPQYCIDCILGDINNDSILNVQDIVLMITLILDGEYDECGDVNSDGTINVQDVVILVNIILDN